jgi:hypothetical protein
MPQLFARVELRGDPTGKDYENLHALMKKNFWYQSITGNRTTDLPHATYQATANTIPDVSRLANDLQSKIESEVWTKAIVLVIDALSWAEVVD